MVVRVKVVNPEEPMETVVQMLQIAEAEPEEEEVS
jgi:hypothetical protein